MSRDRKDPKSFNHSPFKSLKGLSVSGEKPIRPKAQPVPQEPAAESDDRNLFAREMAWLDVHPIDGRVAASTGAEPSRTEPVPPVAEAEVSEFLAAVGNLDKTFRDELPADDDVPRARPRRMKQLEKGELKPSGELDLHGLTRDEALSRTRAFLGHAARQGWPVVVIVTGKGLHSADGPVLRRAVERLLAEARDVVLEWGEAPRRLGGGGALAVFVKTAKRDV